MPAPETTPVEVEPVKPSKLARVKSAAITTSWILIPVAVTGGLSYLSYRMTKMNLDAAKFNLDAAKLNHPTV